MKVLIIGGGIGGLVLALSLDKAGIPCLVFEAVSELRALGVGINLLPHATRPLAELGLLDRLSDKGIETKEICFYTRHGQLVDREPRGRFAGYKWPQISIHRADLHEVLLEAVRERLGEDAVLFDWRCVGVEQNAEGVYARFVDGAGAPRPIATGSVAVACDGIHSAIRRQMHPTEMQPLDHGTTSYRGVTRRPPFLTGGSMVYVGTYDTGKLVAYPVRNNIDAAGQQLINWVLEVRAPNDRVRDWHRRFYIKECIGPFKDWQFDWLDVAELLRSADEVLQYPNIDQNPLPFWTQDRVTLLGDAAHPMLPRGSNGAAQAIIDAKLLAELLAGTAPREALARYEALRLPVTSAIVHNNRDRSPDAILRVIEERTGGKPFDKLSDFISREEIDSWQEAYKTAAGFQHDRLAAAESAR